MMAIITGMLPLAVQILGWFLGKSAASDAVKTKYLELVSLIEGNLGVAVRLGESERAQVERLRKEFPELNQPQKP